MRNIRAEEITDAISNACIRACCEVEDDVIAALQNARETESKPHAKEIISQILENATLAKQIQRPCCQDTGMAVVFLSIGQEVHIDGDLNAAVNEGVRRGYRDGYMRKSVLSPITRIPTGDNTPAVIHIELTQGDRVRIVVAPKGFGSENKGALAMLNPSDGIEGVENFIVETIKKAGGGFCPPGIAGVGVGGTMEACCLLAKKQLLRRVGERSPTPHIAEMEQRLLKRVNDLKIGAMGLGGDVTLIGMHIAEQGTHIASLPVAVNLQCHAARHAEVVL